MLQRRIPLVAKVALRRKTPMKPGRGLTGGKPPRRTALATSRPKPAVPPKVRNALAERSGGRCEIGFRGCTGRAVDAAHRLARGLGGRHGTAEADSSRLANVGHSCRWCHRHAHENPAVAYATGWMLRTGEDPLTEPVLYRGRPALLDDNGQVHNYEQAA